VILFGPFTAHLDSGELRRDGHKIRLQAQPFDLLVMLLEHPGEVLTREEIRDKLWPAGTFVDFDHSLGTAINKIRAALNDSVEKPRFVETLPKRGYRFIADLLPSPISSPDSFSGAQGAVADTEPVPSAQLAAVVTTQKSVTPPHSRLILVSSTILFALLAFSAYRWRERSFRASASGPIQSLAVLPLENLSSNREEEFFANGMTDELITNLAKIRSLRVISRTSVLRYRGTHKPISEIAGELGVDGIVEGTILRVGGKVRITAQLIQASTDRHLWAEEYERDAQDVLVLQGEVARGIAQSIHVRITPQEQLQLSGAATFDPGVEELYWKGLYFINKTTVPDYKHAQEYFNQMLKKDPANARAWTGVAMAAHHLAMWGDFDGFAAAKAAALKAIALDDSLAEAQAELGMLSFEYDWNIVEAERQLRRAIGIAGNVYFAIRKYDDAIRALQFALEIDPNYRMAHARMIWRWEMKGEYEKAIEELQLSNPPSSGKSAERDTFKRLRDAYAACGVAGYRRESLAIALEGYKPGAHYGTDGIAALYAQLGESDKALD
jgi:TolB-like protein/DNA-binding winged helix-turn-helix (wHTH) protein